MPKNFSVVVYLPNAEPKTRWLYGWDEVLRVASRHPDVDFTVVGLRDGVLPDAPANVKSIGWTHNMEAVLSEATVLWRPVRHDGLSFMVLEALAHGRHVIYTYPLPGCVQANNADSVCREIERLLVRSNAGALGLNQAGMRYIAAHYDPETVQSNLLERWKAIIERRSTGADSAQSSVANGDSLASSIVRNG